MTKKELSRLHEEYIAQVYGGTRSRSSGAAHSDKGDVRTSEEMIECKMSGYPGGTTRRTTILNIMEKAADEAWSESRQPVMCLRLYNPDSPLSNTDGWVDFTIRLTSDDVARSDLIGYQAG